MHHANLFYGHAEAFARYVGLEQAPTIWGYVQHGWNLHDGFAVGTPFAPGYPKFVWSPMVRRRAILAGLSNVVVIGSPFAYLCVTSDAGSTAREGTLVYPFHGWEGQEVAGDHSLYARLITDREEPPFTACLYWNDYQDDRIREAYASNGFRVISHGQRGHMYRGHDPLFLIRQLTELRRHRRVLSNRMGSALLYAAATGASIGVYGDPMVLANDHAILGGMDKQIRLYPEFHQDEVPAAIAREVAVAELGMDHLLSAEEIRWRFGWPAGVEASAASTIP